jgi:hypothetical protein
MIVYYNMISTIFIIKTRLKVKIMINNSGVKWWWLKFFNDILNNLLIKMV